MAFLSRSRTALALVAAAALFILAPPAAAAAFSDVGPVGWSSGTSDPNLGVLNQGARTLNFDGGWRFKLVNTANTRTRPACTATRRIRWRQPPASMTPRGPS